MAPVNMNAMEHFTHPGHQLFKLHDNIEFLCDGCKTVGTGPKYRCHPCDFDLHERCATAPQTLTTSMHPHPLTLARCSGPLPVTNLYERSCDICANDIKGLYYRCQPCGFDVHPLCAQLPENVTHNYHKQHILTLQAAPAGRFCGVCARPCGTSLRYRCGPCNFDIHSQCVVILPPADTSGRNTTPQFGTPPPFAPPSYGSTPAAPPPYGVFPHGAGSSSSNPYNAYGFGNQDSNMYNYRNQDPNNTYDYRMNQVQSGPGTGGGTGKAKAMVAVGKLALGMLSNMTLGSDVTNSFM